jgi:palmitoyltransferase ZDHHC3/7/25
VDLYIYCLLLLSLLLCKKKQQKPQQQHQHISMDRSIDRSHDDDAVDYGRHATHHRRRRPPSSGWGALCKKMLCGCHRVYPTRCAVSSCCCTTSRNSICGHGQWCNATARIDACLRAWAVWWIPPAHDDTHDYYEDLWPTDSFDCTMGTQEGKGIWMNGCTDRVGTLMSLWVWMVIGYAAVMFVWLAQAGRISVSMALVYVTLCTLVWMCHVKTSWTDPGAIPLSAIPPWVTFQTTRVHVLCSHCQSYKPPHAHHCRICQRCISRMDHHCPWMNNCIGAGNLKHFILFLVYTWLTCAFTLSVFAYNYFACVDPSCEYTGTLIIGVRVLTGIALWTGLFTTSMLMNVIFGIVTGIGTIDRLKMQTHKTWEEADQEPIPLSMIFGMGSYWTWLLPMDPLFADYDQVMGYTTRQRLLRLQQQMQQDEVYSPIRSYSSSTSCSSSQDPDSSESLMEVQLQI